MTTTKSHESGDGIPLGSNVLDENVVFVVVLDLRGEGDRDGDPALRVLPLQGREE